MKTSVFFLSGMLMVVHLLIAAPGHGQGTGSTVIDIEFKSASLRQIFNAIESRAKVIIMYEATSQMEQDKVSISAKGLTVKEILNSLLKNRKFKWTMRDNVIRIEEDSALHKSVPSIIQLEFFLPITGRITDAEGNPVVGVNVMVKGSKRGTTTDGDGEFTLNIVEGQTLVISSVEFETKEVKIDNRDNYNIILKRSVASLNEVVINKGYYTTTQRLNTGSVSRVSGEIIDKQPVANPLAALSGRMPGVVITQQTGVPGGGISVQVRGRNSLRTIGNDPFYIVDGVPYISGSVSSASTSGQILGGMGNNPLNFINAADIKSIEVLKDADATAIYGSRGANGVILITTNNGIAGKTKMNLNAFKGVASVGHKMELLNTEQYLEMRNEAFKNDGTSPVSSDFDLLQYDKDRYTDWPEELLGGHSDIANVQASFSGGNEQTQFQLSGGYYKEGTVFPGDFSYNKRSLHVSLQHTSPNQKLKLALTTSYVHDNSDLPQNDLTGYAINLPPNAPSLYNASGGLNWAYSWQFYAPLLYLERDYSGTTNNLLTNITSSYEIAKDLKVKLNFGYNSILKKENSTYPIMSYPPVANITTGSAFFADNEVNSWIAEPQIDYKKAIGRGKLEMLAGITFQENVTEGKTLDAGGFKNDNLLENITAAATVRLSAGNYTQYKYNAVFGRINYNWKDQYMINLTGRRDGSSRFGNDQQFANFGAIGAAWIITNNFPIHFLNFAKIRTSYGITGNDQIGDYAYLRTYTSTSQPYLGSAGLIPARLANPDYSWEKTRKIEAAFDVTALENRLSMTLGFYLNRSSNQLVGYSLPDITGFTNIQYNLPATVQNSGWEFEGNYRILKSGKFSWETSFNITIPKNKLISYPNLEGSTYANRYVIGESLSIQKKYHSLGIDKNTGTYQVEDVNNDGRYSSPADLRAFKSIQHQYYGGMLQAFTYKGFKLDIFLQFVKQTGSFYFSNAPGMFGNQPVEVMSRWQKSGDDAVIQKFTQNFGGAANQSYQNTFLNGDAGITDASFIRLKNVALSWQPDFQKYKRTGFLQGSTIFLKGQNLFTMTNYKGMDPENQSVQNLPPLSVMAIGMQINIK